MTESGLPRGFNRWLLALGFLFGLTIPRYSFLALVVCAGLLFLTPFRLPRIWRLSIPLLLAFTALHEGISTYYGFRSPSALLTNPVMYLAAYMLGLGLPSLPSFRTGPWMGRFFLSIALGMAIFALLGATLKPIRIEGADLLRKSPSFWDSALVLNGTVYGLYASLGMVLFPLGLFRGKKLVSISFLDGVCVLLAAGLGLAANILFQNRSPFLAMALTFVWVIGMLLVWSADGTPWGRFGLVIRLVWLGVLGFGLIQFLPDGVELILFRFQTIGFGSSGRVEAWQSVLSHLFDQPFGGRRYPLAGLSYAHNLFLDVANDSGLLPLLLLLLLMLIHAPGLLRGLRHRADFNTWVLFSALISLLMGALAEPMLVGSPTHFALLLMVLGWGTAAFPSNQREETS